MVSFLFLALGRTDVDKKREYLALAEEAIRKEVGVHLDEDDAAPEPSFVMAWLAYSSPSVPQARAIEVYMTQRKIVNG